MNTKQLTATALGFALVAIAVLYLHRDDIPRTVSIANTEARADVPSASSATVTPPVSKPAAAKIVLPDSKNFWEVGRAALNSNDPTYVFTAYSQAMECVGVLREYPTWSAWLSGAQPAEYKGNLTAERQKAIEGLLKKCSGFISAGIPASKELAQDIKQRGQALNGAEFRALDPKGRMNAADQVSALLFSESDWARQSSLRSVLRYAVEEQPGKINRDAGSLVILGGMLALCDTGMDCSEDGTASQLQCATSGRCVKNLWDDWHDGLSPGQVAAVDRYRKEIGIAIQNKDLSYLSHM